MVKKSFGDEWAWLFRNLILSMIIAVSLCLKFFSFSSPFRLSVPATCSQPGRWRWSLRTYHLWNQPWPDEILRGWRGRKGSRRGKSWAYKWHCRSRYWQWWFPASKVINQIFLEILHNLFRNSSCLVCIYDLAINSSACIHNTMRCKFVVKP